MLPGGLTARRRAGLGLDPEDLAAIEQRTHEGLCVLGMRFSQDKGCPAERFETLRRTLGDAFEGIEIDSSPGNPFAIPSNAHAVLTVDLVDESGHPTRAALDRGLASSTNDSGPRAGPTAPRPPHWVSLFGAEVHSSAEFRSLLRGGGPRDVIRIAA